MVDISSRAIRAAVYSQKAKTLRLRMRDGSNIVYEGVEPETYRQFLEAESAGEYFNHNIRNVYNFHYV
jgi:hypothetical protein